MAIKDDDYNKARALLIQAGSRTAEASHVKHTQGKGSPTWQGQNLLRGARDEFRTMDRELPDLYSEMTQTHYTAIHHAAKAMDIQHW